MNPRVDGSPKRKALKVRNFAVEGQLPMDVVKIERHRNILSQTAERQNNDKCEVEWALKKQSSNRYPDRNKDEIKRNKIFMTIQRCRRMKIGNGQEIEKGGNVDRGQSLVIKSSESQNETGSCRGIQTDHEVWDNNEHEVKRNRNTLASRDVNETKTIPGRNDNEDQGQSEIKWSRISHEDRGDHEEAGVNKDVTNWNGNDFKDQGHIKEHIKEPDKNTVKVEGSGNVPVDKSSVKKMDGNEDKDVVQRNGNSAKCENSKGSNNGFPRKTKTLGLLCRKFVLVILIAFDFRMFF